MKHTAKVEKDYLHICSAYVATTPCSNDNPCYTLVIETDLDLPVKGRMSRDPQMDTLLSEIHDMKERFPALFSAVENIEIREKTDEVRDLMASLTFINAHREVHGTRSIQ